MALIEPRGVGVDRARRKKKKTFSVDVISKIKGKARF